MIFVAIVKAVYLSGINATVTQSGDISVTSSEDTTDSTVTLTADTGYDSYSWTVNDDAQDSTSNTLTFSVTSGVTYDVCLTSEKDGITYTSDIQVVAAAE